MKNQAASIEKINPLFKDLYKLGAVAAWLVAGLTLSEIIFFTFYPQPDTIRDWFALFQSNKLIGLLVFWGFEGLMYGLFIFVFLALYFTLRKTNPSWMVIAITFALLGIGIFFATNNPFSMLTLSDQYAIASVDAEKSAFLAAGEAILANTNQRGVGGFNMGLFLVSVAGLIISTVMLHSQVFSKETAYLGIFAFAFSLADYLRQALTESVLISLLVILTGALLFIIWFILVGRRLYRLGYRADIALHNAS